MPNRPRIGKRPAPPPSLSFDESQEWPAFDPNVGHESDATRRSIAGVPRAARTVGLRIGASAPAGALTFNRLGTPPQEDGS